MKFILFSFSLLFNGPIFANIYFPFENLAQVKDVETQLIGNLVLWPVLT